MCSLIGDVNFKRVTTLIWQGSDEPISMQHEVDGPVNLVLMEVVWWSSIWER